MILAYQDHQHAQQGSPHQCTEGTLHRGNRLDGFSVLWDSSNLELHARTRQLPYAWVHQQSPHEVPTPKPVYPQHAPSKAAPIQYGTRVQRVEVDTTQPLSPKDIKRV
jgi:hypothetical protein